MKYIQIVLAQPATVITLPIKEFYRILRAFQDQQDFCEQLGQQDYWSKNRYDLLKQFMTSPKILDQYIKITDDDFITVQFRDCQVMDSHIQRRIWELTFRRYNQRTTIVTDNFVYQRPAMFYERDKSKSVTPAACRVLSTDFIRLYLRPENIAAFDRELTQLIEKYTELKPREVSQGRRIFDAEKVADRYYSLHYGRRQPKKTDI